MSTTRKKKPPLSTGRETVDLGDGRSVVVRHARFRKLSEIERAFMSISVAEDRVKQDGNAAGVAVLQQDMDVLKIYTRWGVVGGSGLVDDNGEKYTVEHEDYDGFGSVATERLLDCLDQGEVVRIIQAVGKMQASPPGVEPGAAGDGSDEGN